MILLQFINKFKNNNQHKFYSKVDFLSINGIYKPQNTIFFKKLTNKQQQNFTVYVLAVLVY